MWGRSNEPEFQQKMAAQADWLAGKHGGVLQVYSKRDGRKLAEQQLDFVPAFDGMVAAKGSLYLVAKDGSIRGFRGE